jgi:predicted enzyme related to lactoylglutathione lyase
MVPRAKLVMLNIPVTDQKQGRLFYRSLLGQPLVHSHYDKEHRHHAPAASGVNIDVGPPQKPGQPMMAMFAVRSLKNTVKRLTKLGGTVMADNVDIPVAPAHKKALGPEWKRLYKADVGSSMGTVTIMKDPFDNGIILVEMEDWAEQAFKAGHLSDRELEIHDVALKIAEKTFGTSEYDKDPTDPNDDIYSDKD